MSQSSEGRERDIIRAFVDLSHELVDNYDIVDMLVQLTTSCAELLDVASAGLLLADTQGTLHLAASSSERMQNLELLQLQRSEGPCLDCYRDGAAVVVDDIESAPFAERWPTFSQAALKVGYRSVHAVPMKIRDQVHGTLGLFSEGAGHLSSDDLNLAQALAHVATVSIINGKSADDRDSINAQLQHALTSRIVLEQAKGVVANATGLDMAEAFSVLRRYARNNNEKLTDVATQVVKRELHSETLVSQVP